MIYKFIIALFLVMMTNSCTGDRCEELKFMDSFQSVRENIIKLDSLLVANNNICDARYDIVFGYDGVLIRNSNTNEGYSGKTFCSLEKEDIIKLKKISSIMKRNYIIFSFQKNGDYFYNFNRCNEDNDFYMTRYVVIDREGIRGKISAEYVILDAKDGLLLLSPKDLPSYYH